MSMIATKAICIRLPENIIDFLKKEARLKSVESNNDVNYTDLIRDAIINTYPSLIDRGGNKNGKTKK